MVIEVSQSQKNIYRMIYLYDVSTTGIDIKVD